MAPVPTPTANKRDAQRRADRIRMFREELADLEHAGILSLSPEQRAGVDAHHQRTLADLARHFDVDTTESQKQISWGMRIVSTLGGIAFCAAVVLFFHRIWGSLNTPAQVAVLIATPLIMLAAAHYAAARERTLYYASLLSLVAFAAFILNLSVIGSIFNLTPTPTALLVWGAFGLIVAYGYRLRMVLVAGLTCLAGYTAALLSSWSGAYWSSFPERPESLLPAAAILLCVPLIRAHRRFTDFDWIYRICGLFTAYLAILVLAEVGATSYLPLPAQRAKIAYQLFGFAMSGYAVWYGTRARLASVVNLSAVFFALLLFIRMFDWWWDWMPGYLFFLIIGITAVVLLAVFRKLRARASEAQS